MDIKGDWKKRAVCGLMVLAMALSLLPTSILAADTRSVTDNAIKNGSFEQPASNIDNSPQLHADLVFGWDTTASDHLIEFGSKRNGKNAPQLTGNNKEIPDGDQFAELNADEESTLYQYATTVGGNVYEWGLSHRGRMGVDRMALIIGPKQNVDPAKPSKSGKDQFMQMTDWVKNNAVQMGVSIPDIGCSQKITVYSKPFAKNGGFANNADNVPFSKSPSNVYGMSGSSARARTPGEITAQTIRPMRRESLRTAAATPCRTGRRRPSLPSAPIFRRRMIRRSAIFWMPFRSSCSSACRSAPAAAKAS